MRSVIIWLLQHSEESIWTTHSFNFSPNLWKTLSQRWDQTQISAVFINVQLFNPAKVWHLWFWRGPNWKESNNSCAREAKETPHLLGCCCSAYFSFGFQRFSGYERGAETEESYAAHQIQRYHLYRYIWCANSFRNQSTESLHVFILQWRLRWND